MTEGTSGLSCRGQVPLPRAVLEMPLNWSVTTSRNGPVAMRPAEDGAPLVAGAPPATLSPAPTALLVPQSLMCRPSFLHCWELQM